MEGELVTIKGANIGIAVKDKSHFEGMTITIQDVNVAGDLRVRRGAVRELHPYVGLSVDVGEAEGGDVVVKLELLLSLQA